MQAAQQGNTGRTIYQLLGGEQGVRELVRVFYDLVESEPVGAPLMALHNVGNGLSHAREAQFEYLSGFFGGPQLYVEHYGHSNVRKMHEHLGIGKAERDAWLACMDMALAALPVDADLHDRLMAHFSRIANVLVNTP